MKGVNFNDTANISYRLTFGETGNIDGKVFFETQSIIDKNGKTDYPLKSKREVATDIIDRLVQLIK